MTDSHKILYLKVWNSLNWYYSLLSRSRSLQVWPCEQITSCMAQNQGRTSWSADRFYSHERSSKQSLRLIYRHQTCSWQIPLFSNYRTCHQIVENITWRFLWCSLTGWHCFVYVLYLKWVPALGSQQLKLTMVMGSISHQSIKISYLIQSAVEWSKYVIV